MKKESAIKVTEISKSFKLPTENTNSLKRTIVNYFQGIKGYREQKVLRNISFEVEKGDFFGIVGRNGSGKSTLLKIISQIYVPEHGTVDINGKLVSFIELGVGFNQELSGKENVYLNGALLGFSTSEIDEMYGDIVEFAELGDFMNQKLKNYSSGMQVRLAFSVAIQSKSDILVLDEVLAVGDEAFQRKCNDYFMKAREDKKTIVLVTHSMDAVRKYCNKAMMIDKGEVKIIGTPEDVANQYSLSNVTDTGSATVIEGESDEEVEVKEEQKMIENLKVELLSTTIIDFDNDSTEVEFMISYDVIEEMKTYVAFSMVDIDKNIWLYNDNSYDSITEGKGHKQLRYKCSLNELNGCTIKLNVSIRNDKDEPFAFADKENSPVIIVAKRENMTKSERISSSGVIRRNGLWIAE
ncbi:ABC transporter ATP-binding protein [Enterococcus sp. LJL99]